MFSARRAQVPSLAVNAKERLRDDSPPEEEEISPEEDAAAQEARDELAAGAEPMSHDEIRREFGIG